MTQEMLTLPGIILRRGNGLKWCRSGRGLDGCLEVGDLKDLLPGTTKIRTGANMGLK